MPSWKKVIVSGSDASLNSLNVINGVTGSLFGTASWANNVVSASYALNATSASYALTATSASFAPTATNVFLQGGNSFGTTALLGTNDVQNLQFETSGSVRMTISGSNGNVGIGTTSPMQKLHVSGGNALIEGNIYFGNSSHYLATDNATYAMLSSNRDLQLARSGNPALTINASGNVGIGTTSPSYLLDVTNNTRISGSILLGSNTLETTVTGLYVLTNGNNASVSTYYYDSILSLKAGVSGGAFSNRWSQIQLRDGNGGTGYINFFTSGSFSRMYIDQVGNIGIATTTASLARLQVQGNVSASSYTGSLFGTASRADNATSASFATNAVSASFATQANTSFTASTADNFTVRGTLTAQTIVAQTITSSTDFVTGSTRFGSLMSNTHQFTGSVSITGSLNVVGTGITGSLLGTASRADNATSASYALNTTSASYALNSTSASYALTATSASFAPTATNVFLQGGNSFGTQALLGTNDVQNLAFETSGAIRMTITSGGSVGVGITTPSHPLDVFTSSLTTIARFYANDGTFNPRFTIEGTSEGIRLFQTYSTTAGNLMFGTGATERMRISTGGNVGIGTTSPAFRLDVSGSARMLGGSVYLGQALTASGHLNAYELMTFNIDVDNNDSNRYFAWYTNAADGAGTELMRLTEAGNVGIGTTSPGAKLDVWGVLRVTGSATTLATFESSGANAFIGLKDSSGDYVYLGNDDGDFLIQTPTSAYSTKLIVKDDGNVGIGTTAPVNKLQVAGGGIQIGNAATTTIDLRLTRTNGGITADAHYFVATANTPNHSWIEGGYMTNELAGVVTSPNSGYPYIENYAGQGSATTKTFGFVNKTTGSFTSTDITASLGLSRTGQISFYQYKTTSSFTGTVVGFLGFDSSGNILTTTGSGGGASLSGGSTNYVARWASSTTLTTGSLFDNGNVGIGTTAPNQSLHINKAGDFQLRLQNTNTGGGYWNIGQTDNAFNASGSKLVFVPNSPDSGNATVIFTAGGSVGIGTLSPTSKLHVSGTTGGIFEVDGASAITALYVSASGNVGIGTLTPDSRLHVAVSGSSGAQTIVATLASNTLRPVLQFSETLTGGINSGMSIEYDGQGSSGTNKMYINDVNGSPVFTVMSGGNVGIGTTSPTAKLHLSGSNTDTIFQINSPASSSILVVSGSGGVGIGNTSPYGKLEVRQSSLYDGVYITETASSRKTIGIWHNGTDGHIETTYLGAGSYTGLSLDTYSTSRIYIAASGSVGIGTTAPASLLHVAGNATIGYSTSTAAPTDGLLVSGNVGIGTTIPAFKLDVYSTSTATARFYNNQATATFDFGSATNTSYSDIILRASNGSGEIFKAGTGYTSYGGANALNIYNSNAGIHFFPNGTGTSVMAITGSNVGIGTTNPISPFHIYKSGAQSQLTIEAAGAANPVLYLKNSSGYGTYVQYTTVGSTFFSIYDATANTDRILINSNGNVGIGSTTPAYALDVNGTGRFTSIIETSTRTLKDNIQPYATEIDKFKQLEPVSFTWKETGKQDVGLIAEDVEQIFPEFVSKTDDGNVQGINYGKLATIFINVLKQQQEKIELLEEQIKKLTS